MFYTQLEHENHTFHYALTQPSDCSCGISKQRSNYFQVISSDRIFAAPHVCSDNKVPLAGNLCALFPHSFFLSTYTRRVPCSERQDTRGTLQEKVNLMTPRNSRHVCAGRCPPRWQLLPAGTQSYHTAVFPHKINPH